MGQEEYESTPPELENNVNSVQGDYDSPPEEKPDAPNEDEFPSYSNEKRSSSPQQLPEEVNAPKSFNFELSNKISSNSGGNLVDSVPPAGSGSVQDEVNRIVSYLENPANRIKCHNEKFVGSGNNSTGEYRDGAYHLCNEEPYWIPPEKRMTPCLGYSFGIDYEWSFDDALAMDFGCEVHSFDPGMYDEPMHFTRKDRIFFHRMGIDTSNSDEKYG